MKNNKGFSLVELIVVIAIMAILAAVAVIGVSVYVPKAQKAADQQAINDVMDALTLYYYSNPETVTQGYVILGSTGVVEADAVGEAAMKATFGEDKWETAVKLQYADWQGESSTLSYRNSSYYGKESSLIDTVDGLTTALGNVIEQDANLGNALIGGNFKTFLEDYDVDTDNGKAVGNAAVLYVAQNTKDKEAEIMTAVYTGLGKSGSSSSLAGVADNIYNELRRTGMGEAAAMATVYAYTEGFVQHTNQADKFKPDFGNVSGADAATDALAALGAAFNELDPSGFDAYVRDGQLDKDLKGYVDMMDTIYNNKDIVSGNLASDTCYTDGTVENMLKGHAAMSSMSVATSDGQVAVVLVVDVDGNVLTHVSPMNWDK